MARASLPLIDALRRTASKIQEGAPYQWGHMGSCNCGNLAQEITKLSKAQIHAYAMQGHGDWNEQLNDYCETSQIPMDLMVHEMLTFGFSMEDLKNLERLADKDILAQLPLESRYLKHNVRNDVVLYLKTWASMLEEKLVERITLPVFEMQETAELV